MKNKSLIPTPPLPFVIETQDKENLEKWIAYFRGLSPRVVVSLPSDPDFDLNFYYESALSKYDDFDKSEIVDWPELAYVAFVVYFDSAIIGQKPTYLKENCYIFCLKDHAFGLYYFEWVEGSDASNGRKYQYSLNDYTKEALCWKHIAEKCIRDKLIEIESSVPKPID